MASRFEKELEFVQLLCNPEYIRWLYKNNFFARKDFRDFMAYLLYFREIPYRNCLLYPQALPILEMLLEDDVASKLADESFYTRLSEDQFYMWKHREA